MANDRDTRPIVELELNHPLAVALRRQIKGDFIINLSRVPQSKWQWKEAKPVVYGSTLMHQLNTIDKINFPFPGVRVSDIDITALPVDGNYGDGFETACREHIPALLKQAVLNGNFDIAFPKKGDKPQLVEVWDKQALAEMDPSAFSKDFYVYRTFSPEDVIGGRLDKIPNAADRERVMAAIRDDERLWDKQTGTMKANVKVQLVISPNIPNRPHKLPLGLLLDPKPLYPGADHPSDGNIAIYRGGILDTLAGKYERMMKRKVFKPTDLLDVYNICRAQPPIVNLDPNDPNNDLDTLRVMIVTRLAMSGQIKEPYFSKPEELLKILDPSPANLQKLMDIAASEIATHRMEDVKQHMGDMVKTTRDLLTTVFRKRSEKAYGPLNYTPNEVRFAAALLGTDPETILHPKPPERQGWRAALFSKRKLHDPSQTTLPHANIAIDYLKAEFPKVFERHPELETNIRRDPSLAAIVNDTTDRGMYRSRSAAGWIGDF